MGKLVELMDGFMKVFINPNCSFGKGALKWRSVQESLHERIGDFNEEVISSPESMYQQVSQAVADGENQFIAAGGDGTVNLLLNAIMKLDEPSRVTLGAVGLGSSNDFHKPLNPASTIGAIPVRADFRNTMCCDVIKIRYRGSGGSEKIRYCLINASIGITAQGNLIFSSGGYILTLIQRFSVDTAILIAAMKAIFTYRDISCRLQIEGEDLEAEVSNLGVIKSPHFTGNLCYDTPIEPDDGLIGVNLCTGLNIRERINMLFALYHHHFSDLPKTKCWKSTRLNLSGDRMFPLEMDGELVQTDNVEFHVIPKIVRCCR